MPKWGRCFNVAFSLMFQWVRGGVEGGLRLSNAAENPEELLFPLCRRKTVAHNNEAKMANKISLTA